MKPILFFLNILIFSQISLKAQQWIKIYNANQNAYAYYIIESYDKGYILSCDINYIYGWIIKTDINGNILWDKKIGDGQHDYAPMNSEQTLDKGLIICGTTTKINNQFAPFILKLNNCGELEWCKIIYNSQASYSQGVMVKPISDGGYIMLGMFNEPGMDKRINLFKFDNFGNLIWHHYYPPDSLLFNEDAYNLIVCNDGYLITGDGYYPDPGNPGTGILRPYFIKTDTLGNESWNTVYGILSYYYGDAASSVQVYSGNFFSAARHYTSNGDHPALVKVLKNGTESYNSDLISNSQLGIATTITIKDDTSLIIGSAWSPDNNAGPVGLIKADTLGNVNKIKIFLNTTHTVTSTAKTFDNKFISLMTHCTPLPCKIYAFKVNSNLEYDSIYTQPFTYDSLCPYPIVSDTIDPNCDLIVDVNEHIVKPETSELKVYPNPASNIIILEFPKYIVISSGSGKYQSKTVYHQWNSTILEAYDLFGRRVFSEIIPKVQEKLELYISGWQHGMYLFRLVYQKRTAASAKVVIQ